MRGQRTKAIGRFIVVLGLIPLLGILSGCEPKSTPTSISTSTPTPTIEAYFSGPLAGDQGETLASALLEALNSAQKTIDAAVYSITSDEVIAALRAACARGVRIRIVTEASDYQGQLDGLRCVKLHLDQNERAMHAKFAVLDGRVVWTGSANWSEGSLSSDANNALIIRDRAVAQAYEAEFEQMFAGRYGTAKEDNNEEEFRVGEAKLEVYFTPSDHPRMRLLGLLAQAKKSIDIAMFYLTDRCLFTALVAALDRGVRVRAVWDMRGWMQFPISWMDELLGLGVGIVDAIPGLVHHKYAVIDNEIVVTGSANWTRSGLEWNDEDLLVVHDPELAARYTADFERLYHDAQDYDLRPLSPPRIVLKHYNHQDVLARVEWRPHLLNKPDYYELCRARTSHGPCEVVYRIPNDQWFFVDEEATPGERYYYCLRGVVGDQASAWSDEYATVAEKPDCPAAGAVEECSCADGKDNDGDGYIDCRDYDCAAATACIAPDWPEPPQLELTQTTLTAEEAEANLDRYRDKWVRVKFYVVSTKETEKVIYLDSPGDYRKNFTAVIFQSDKLNFTSAGIDPALDYDHKLLEVQGFLREYNGPEIVLCSPAQVRVLE